MSDIYKILISKDTGDQLIGISGKNVTVDIPSDDIRDSLVSNLSDADLFDFATRHNGDFFEFNGSTGSMRSPNLAQLRRERVRIALLERGGWKIDFSHDAFRALAVIWWRLKGFSRADRPSFFDSPGFRNAIYKGIPMRIRHEQKNYSFETRIFTVDDSWYFDGN